jgi:hypothetical protein
MMGPSSVTGSSFAPGELNSDICAGRIDTSHTLTEDRKGSTSEAHRAETHSRWRVAAVRRRKIEHKRKAKVSNKVALAAASASNANKLKLSRDVKRFQM